MWSFTHKAFEIVSATLPAIAEHEMDCAQAKAVINKMQSKATNKKKQAEDEDINGEDIS